MLFPDWCHPERGGESMPDPAPLTPGLWILWNSFTYPADLSIRDDPRAEWQTQAGLNQISRSLAWKMTLQVMESLDIYPPHPPPPPPSQVNSTDFKRTLWILRKLHWEQSRNMAGWLCTVGVGDILIHVCISACAALYIHLMNLQLPSRQTSEESQRGAQLQCTSMTYCLMCSCTVCHFILCTMHGHVLCNCRGPGVTCSFCKHK